MVGEMEDAMRSANPAMGELFLRQVPEELSGSRSSRGRCSGPGSSI